MPFEIKVIAEPGSATECGDCFLRDEHCLHFRKRIRIWDPVRRMERYFRLPECVEAERRAKEGA